MTALEKPDWIRSRAPSGPRYEQLRDMIHARGLATVCESARCPNLGRCWGEGTATVMVMGDTCTRGCRFCHVKSAKRPPPLDPEEPARLAELIGQLDLDYVVVTSVDRDDLADLGASHLAETVRALKAARPELRVELLMPDLGARRALIEQVVAAGPDVVGHNLETVRRLSPRVRDPRADYELSLETLVHARAAGALTKSSIMLGFGETPEEVLETLFDLREVGVELLTVGQYLQPSSKQLPVQRYVHPESFARLERRARLLGFKGVAAGPLVRSSFEARRLFESAAGGAPG